MRILLSMAVLAALLPMAPAQAETVALTYEIRKESTPIGRELVHISRQGAMDIVEVETRTRAKVLFLEFRYDHRRHEEWLDGKLVRMVADTDDDGTKTHVEAVSAAGGWTLSVNGQQSQRPGDALPLTLWGKAVVTAQDLFSIIDAKPYKVQVVALGVESITVDGKAMEAQHFHIAGDVERDLWYGGDNMLLRATFQRAGFPIEIVRVEK